MRLKGSCHCGRVRFSLESEQPWPYLRCYCSACRKTAGAGGYCINLGGSMASLEVEGQEHVKVYRALRESGGQPVLSRHERHFCGHCGCHLWAYNPQWPQLVHPVAGAIDTPLPPAPGPVHMMLGSKAQWVPLEGALASGEWGDCFDHYPNESLADHHARGGYVDAE